MIAQANCPHCGGPVSFQVGTSLVVVCPSCRTLVARTDRAVEDIGRSAAIIDSGSPLRVGAAGRYRGTAFTLVGRVQFRHWAGGIWDEWYAAFSDGRWGWLAEAQGRFMLTFDTGGGKGWASKIAKVVLGSVHSSLDDQHTRFVVSEKGTANVAAAEGELPWRPTPGEDHAYADLSGPEGTFATIDYSDAKHSIFVGQEVTLEAIGMKSADGRSRTVRGAALSCPRCGAPLELKAPDLSERVRCPSCGSLLDIEGGDLKFFKSLETPKIEPRIAVGRKGTFQGVSYTVVGFVRRSVTFDQKYTWDEYLLYDPDAGFRWLVQSDDHWSFVSPVAAGDVIPGNKNAVYQKDTFRIFQKAQATVEYVLGEFYWKIEVGEIVDTADYVCPPRMLTMEISSEGDNAELNVSLGTYLPVGGVEAMFGIADLPTPDTVAPNQPYPASGVGKIWFRLAAVLVGLAVLFEFGAPRRSVLRQTIPIEAVTKEQEPQVYVSDPFVLDDRRNLVLAATSNVQNTWLDVEGGLINLKTGLVQPVSIPTEYYSGWEDGESWSEGVRNRQLYLSALPGGEYALRLEIQPEPGKGPAVLTVAIDQGVPHHLHFWLAMGALTLPALLIAMRRFAFERRRWENSDFSPYSTGESS
jgi:hypothetical protein